MANPNPSPATRFKKGQSGNPSGKSSAQLKAENEASRISANLTLKALSSLQEKVESGEMDAKDLITADVLRYIQEAQNRAHGTPKATSEVSGPNGGPMLVESIAMVPLKAADE